MSLIDNWHTEDAFMEEDMEKNLAEETPIEEIITEEVIDIPEEEPQLDPEEIITEDFGVICKQNDEVIAYGFWTGTRANVQRLEEWAEYGYEYTSDKYVQGYDSKWYIEGTEPEKPAPTYEEVRQTRENLYREHKDPITCQIQSLRDEEQTEEIITEIEALKIKRAEIVAEIKENNPYPEQKDADLLNKEEEFEENVAEVTQNSTIL